MKWSLSVFQYNSPVYRSSPCPGQGTPGDYCNVWRINTVHVHHHKCVDQTLPPTLLPHKWPCPQFSDTVLHTFPLHSTGVCVNTEGKFQVCTSELAPPFLCARRSLLETCQKWWLLVKEADGHGSGHYWECIVSENVTFNIHKAGCRDGLNVLSSQTCEDKSSFEILQIILIPQ